MLHWKVLPILAAAQRRGGTKQERPKTRVQYHFERALRRPAALRRQRAPRFAQVNELWLSVMNIVSNGSDNDWCNLGSSAEVELIASRREIGCCQNNSTLFGYI